MLVHLASPHDRRVAGGSLNGIQPNDSNNGRVRVRKGEISAKAEHRSSLRTGRQWDRQEFSRSLTSSETAGRKCLNVRQGVGNPEVDWPQSF